MVISSVAIPLPYITLAVLIIALFTIRCRKFTSALLGAQIFLSFIYELINPMGLFAIVAFWGASALHWHYPTSKEWLNTIRMLFIVAIAIGFASHMIPGFYNLRAFDGVHVSSHSLPFTMYLNLDKTIAAAILAVVSGLFIKQINPFNLKLWGKTLGISLVCVAFLIPLAMLSEYVHFEPKFSNLFWLWALNNLLFVCFAEEMIFRGIIQTHLARIANQCHMPFWVPIATSAFLFGIAHAQGGLTYIGFATIAGLFYGYAYHKTKRLESAMLVHFIVNLCHFLLFTYPASATIMK